MNTHTPTTLRKLALIWLALMGLGIATMIAGKATNISSLGTLWMAALMAITWVKAHLILRHFLELDAATGGWSKAFNMMISLIIFILLALYASTSLFNPT